MPNRVTSTDQAATVVRSRILFDTNVWIMIEGFNQAAPRSKVEAYSAAYDALLRNGNEIVYNDYIINEFCNTCARIAYNAHLASGPKQIAFKDFRRSAAYEGVAAAIREACLNIVDAGRYIPIGPEHLGVMDIVDAACRARRDFTDVVIERFCRAEGILLMTDDADFAEADVMLISANKRLQIARAARAGSAGPGGEEALSGDIARVVTPDGSGACAVRDELSPWQREIASRPPGE
ncbi:hypothetical protein ACLBX9_06490 [Methylobacterium sp. A49B]